jgi:hypothetical protein
MRHASLKYLEEKKWLENLNRLGLSGKRGKSEGKSLAKTLSR